MQKKESTFFVLGIILGLIFICMRCEFIGASKDLDKLRICFESSGAKVEESKLSGWALVNNSFYSEKELNDKIDLIIKSFDLDKEKVKRTLETGESLNKATISGTKDSASYMVVIESIKNDDGQEKTCCSFLQTFDDACSNIMKNKYIAEKVFRDAELPLTLNIMIIGSYKGRITKKQSDYLVKRLLNNINAHKVENMENETLISVSAYSSLMNDYIKSKDRRINIQIAIRYSEYDDQTYIFFGSPVIPFEY